MESVAIANSNVALAKYWGKRHDGLNLPYTGSISITMAGLHTLARTHFRSRLSTDKVSLNGAAGSPREAGRVIQFLDLVRQLAGSSLRAEVEVRTNFPVAAGLASSASTFAALSLSATHALGISLSPQGLSTLARRGSGSAARSIVGGFVEWLPGEASDGMDSYAVQVAPPHHWQLGIVIAITDSGPKPISSREGMAHALKQSAFFPAWLVTHEADLEAIRHGITDRDLALVGETAEHNCLKMHAVSMATRPALLYWNAATIAVIHRVRQLRADGLDVYFTIDAGPQVKLICPQSQREAVADAISRVAGVERVLLSEPGPGAYLAEGA